MDSVENMDRFAKAQVGLSAKLHFETPRPLTAQVRDVLPRNADTVTVADNRQDSVVYKNLPNLIGSIVQSAGIVVDYLQIPAGKARADCCVSASIELSRQETRFEQ